MVDHSQLLSKLGLVLTGVQHILDVIKHMLLKLMATYFHGVTIQVDNLVMEQQHLGVHLLRFQELGVVPEVGVKGTLQKERTDLIIRGDLILMEI
jgi:hypothetical protein